MLLNIPTGDRQSQLESKILAAALRQSMKRGDRDGCLLVHFELSKLMAAHGQELPGLDQLRSGQASIPELSATRTVEVTSPSVQPPGEFAPESDNMSAGAEEAGTFSEQQPAAAQTPMDYLDFDETTSLETPAGNQPTEGSRLAGRVAPDPESRSYYSRLAAAPVDSSETVHLCYIRAIRMLLRSQFLDGKAKALNPHEFRKQLKNLGIAYNILFDASTRLDYDLRLLGLREPLSGKHLTVPEEAKTDINGKAKLSLVEVVVLSRTFGADTLLAAVNAARSLPENEFWEYLAQTGAFTQLDFEALHFGTRLIRLGIVSVVQFEQAFQSVRTSGYSLEDILLHAGWVEAEQLRALNESTEELAEPAFQFVEVKVDDTRAPVQENIKVGGNLPSWASQMDWGGEEGAEEGGKDAPAVVPLPATPVEKAAASQIMDYLAPVEEPANEHDTPSPTELPPQISFEPDPVAEVSSPEEFVDSVVLDFSSANDIEAPAQSETNVQFAETAALVDWELPESPTEIQAEEPPAPPTTGSTTDWSVVTPPATLASQYAPAPVPSDIIPPTGGTDWSSPASIESGQGAALAAEQPVMVHNAETIATPAIPIDDRQEILPDPMESLPKPLELSSWQEAVAQALIEPPVSQPISSPLPDSSAPEVSENLPAEMVEAPGGSWASAVEQILEDQAHTTADDSPATSVSQPVDVPAAEHEPPVVVEEHIVGSAAPEPEQPVAEIPEVALELPATAGEAAEATTIEAAVDEAPALHLESPVEVPRMEVGSATDESPHDMSATTEATAEAPESLEAVMEVPVEVPSETPPAATNTPVEASAEPDTDDITDSTIPAKDPRRPREKPARKPRSRREAKNAVQLSKLGTTDSRSQSNTGDDSQNSEPPEQAPNLPPEESPTIVKQPAAEQAEESIAPSAVPVDQPDALSFLNIADGFASMLPDAESRDLLLFGDPYAHFDASNLLTSESNLHSDSQIELENQSLMKALEPEISFEIPTPTAEALPTPPATPHQDAVLEPPQVIDASPDEPPGWSRYRLFFGESERVLPVEGQVAKIGRNRQSVDIAVQEPAVSREHCQLEIGPDGVVLRDLESRHGTYIVRSGTELRVHHNNPLKLAHGDCIRLGKPGAPTLEWLDTKQQIDENAPTDTFAAIPGTADYESLRDTGPRNPKQAAPVLEVLESNAPVAAAAKDEVENAAKPEQSATGKEHKNLAAAAAAMAMSSGLGSDSIDAIMAAMLQPSANQAPPAPVPQDAVPQTANSQDDDDLAAAAAAMAASSGLSKDAIESIIAAMRAAKPSAPKTPLEQPAAQSPPLPEPSADNTQKEKDAVEQTEVMPSPPTPPQPAPADSDQPLVVEVPLVPIPVPPVVVESETLITDDTHGHNGNHDTERSGNGSRIRATADNPYADIDALMAAIDAEVAMARKVIDEDDRKRKRMRQS